MSGFVESIFISELAVEPMVQVDRANIVEGRGIEGDRYFHFKGTFSKPKEELDSGRHVTLIAGEVIDALSRETGEDWRDGRTRRNIVTRGIELNDLLRARIRIGEVELYIDRTCPPCGHLDRVLGVDSQSLLKNRGGLRATILKGGVVRVGDEVSVVSQGKLV